MKKTALCLVLLVMLGGSSGALAESKERVARLEERVESYRIDPAYRDDPYGLIVVRHALKALKEGSGGIGACLVNSTSGEVVQHGWNRQYTEYFRSDLHAEMDLLNRYENRVKKTIEGGGKPRSCENLVLVTSVEPCPMCLTRIINAGIKTMLYVVKDEQGGMVARMDSLPPFWRKFATDREFRRADCSPELRSVARDLFLYSDRSFAGNTDEQ